MKSKLLLARAIDRPVWWHQRDVTYNDLFEIVLGFDRSAVVGGVDQRDLVHLCESPIYDTVLIVKDTDRTRPS